MHKFKQALLTTAAMLFSASLFVLTLPLLLFMASAMFLTGIVGAVVLRYQMSKIAGNPPPVDAVIIEGTYRQDRDAS